MKKNYRIEIDCANCARKVEEAIKKLKNVQSVRVNYITLRMTLEAPDDVFDETLKAAVETGRKIERDFTVFTND